MDSVLVRTGFVDGLLGFDALAPKLSSDLVDLPGGWEIRDALTISDSPQIKIFSTTCTASCTILALQPLRVEIYLPRREQANRLPYIAYTLLEAERNDVGLCTAHAAAAVSPRGDAIILLGDKGAGKTSVTLALAQRGFAPLGDDLIVLARSPLRVLGGNSVFMTRRQNGSQVDYEDKVPVRIALPPAVRGGVLVKAVVRLSVHAAGPALPSWQSTASSWKEGLRLWENLGRYINGLPTPLAFRGSVPVRSLPSLDMPSRMQSRSQIVRAIQARKIRYLAGRDASRVADAIAVLMGR